MLSRTRGSKDKISRNEMRGKDQKLLSFFKVNILAESAQTDGINGMNNKKKKAFRSLNKMLTQSYARRVA